MWELVTAVNSPKVPNLYKVLRIAWGFIGGLINFWEGIWLSSQRSSLSRYPMHPHSYAPISSRLVDRLFQYSETPDYGIESAFPIAVLVL